MADSEAVVFRAARAAGVSPIRLGSSFLVDSLNADVVVDCAETHDVGILGLEGLYRDGDAWRPDLDAIANFSANIAHMEPPAFRSLSIKRAREFVKECMRPGLFIIFTFTDSNRGEKAS